jgi:hypothetical protein
LTPGPPTDITDGTVFRAIRKVGRLWGNRMTAKVR